MDGISEILQSYGASLKETRRLMGELTPRITELREKRKRPLTGPLFLTSLEAKEYDIDIDPGWMLKLIPSEEGYTPSLITPDKWEILQDDTYLSPEGKKYSREQYEARFRVGEAVDYTRLQEAFGMVYPESDVRELLGQMAISEEMPVAERMRAEKAQSEFLQTLRETGRTEDTESLLKAMFPEVTEDEMAWLLGEAYIPKEVPLYQMPLGSFSLSVQPYDKIIEFAHSDPYGLRQAMLFEGRSEITENLMRQIYGTEAITDKYLDDYFLDNIPGKFVRGEWLPDTLEDYWKLYGAGVGDLIEGVAGLADRVEADTVAETLKNIALEGQLIAVDVDMGKPDTPTWYAKNMARMVPFILGIVDMALITGGGAMGVTKAAGGGPFLARIMGTIVGGVTSAVGEGVIEAGHGYYEAEEREFTQAERNAAFDQILRENVALLSLTNTAQFGAAFMLPGGASARFIVKALVFGFEATSEGVEEGAQLFITRRALGDEVLVFDEEFWQNFKLGMCGGLLFGGVGAVYTSIQSRAEGKMTPAQKQALERDTAEGMLQGLSQKEAEVKALDKFAETKEGEAIVTEAVQEIMAEEKTKAIPDISKVTEAAQPMVDVVQPPSKKVDNLAKEHLKKQGIIPPEVVPEVKPPAVEKVKAFTEIKQDLINELKHRAEVGEKLPVGVQATETSIIKHIEGMPESRLRDWHSTIFPKPAVEEAIEIEITPEERVKEQLTAVQKVRKAYQERIATYDETKKALVDYAKRHLPLNVRGKMLTQVKNVKTETDLRKAIAQANKYAEQNAQRVLKAEIRKELKKIKPKKVEGILKGKFTPEVQKALDIIRKNLEADRDMVRAKIADNIHAYEKGEISYDEMIEANNLLHLAGIDGMSSQELAVVLDNIKSLKESGRFLREEARAEEKERIDAIKTEAIGVITGGKGLKLGVATVPSKQLEATKGWLEKLVNWQYSWDNLLDKLSKFHKPSKPYQSPLSKFGNEVHYSRDAENLGLEQAYNKIRENFSRIFKTTNHGRMNQILNKFQNEEINLGTFKNLDGVEVTLKLTKDQAMNKYQQLQDPTLEGTFTDGMRWTDEIKQVVINNLSVQERAWADYQMEFYQEYYIGINEIYSELYGVDLGRNENYSPVKRDLEAQIPENVLTYRDMARYASVLNGSLKSRVANKIPLKFNGSTAILMNHVQQMEHFKAWAHTMRDMRRVFGSKEARTAIRQYHGQPVLKTIDGYLNDMARGGVEKALINREVDFLRRSFTRAVLGFKPVIMLKQIPSVIAYSTEMPITDFVGGVADFWINPVEHYRFMLERSPYLRQRFGKGFERDIKYAMARKPAQILSGKGNAKDWFMFLVRQGDKFAVTQGMWAKYKSEMKGKAKTAENINEAIASAERSTRRTQPTFDLETLSPLQRGGSWVRLLTMFQNQPNKYFRIMADNARNFQYGRGSRAKATANILFAWVVAPALFQFIADAFQFKKEHQLRAWILGPLNWILIFSQFTQSIYGWVTDEPYDYQASPVLQTGRDIQTAVMKTLKIIREGKDPYENISMDDVIAAVEYFAKAAGQLLGYPTPYLVQAERALRAGEPWELVFSRWALRKPEKDDVGKAQDVIANLGKTALDVDLTSEDVEKRKRAEEKVREREEAEAKGLTVEPLDIYNMSYLNRDLRAIYESTLPDDIIADKKSPPEVIAWAEKEKSRAIADTLPNIPLYKINTDKEKDDTIIQYYKQWQAREGIDNLADLKEFDSLYPQAQLGNVTRRQYELLVNYLETPDDKKKQFVKDHPELKVDPRDEWLKAHPIDNARLAIWGQAKILTQEAYDEVRRLIKELDIPNTAMPKFTLPPEGSVKNYFKYLEQGEEFGYNSAEVKLIVAQDDELRVFLDREPITTPIKSLEISVKWRELDDMYDEGIPEKFKGIADISERKKLIKEAREELLTTNPEYADDRRRRDAYSINLPENLTEDYVEWYKTPRKGYGDDWFLMEHKDFYNEMVKLEQLEERDFSKVPDMKHKDLWLNWTDLDAKYDGFGDRDSEFYIEDEEERAENRKVLLLRNPQYRKDRRKREAIEYGLPDNLLDIYVGYYEVPPKSKDSWYVDHPSEPYYEDDWYLLEHRKLYEEMVKLGLWEKRDFSKVPNKRVHLLYRTYLGLPQGQPRLDYRTKYPELDEWLVKAKGYTSVSGRGEEKAEKTPWEEAEEAKRMKEWLEGL